MKPKQLQDKMIDLNWDHAVQFGIPGSRTEENWTVGTDPEALTVLIGIVSDARLRREWVGWLVKFGDQFYTNRLKRILADLFNVVDSDTLDEQLSGLKLLLQSVEEQSEHTFESVQEFLRNCTINEDNLQTGNAKIRNIDRRDIVEDQPTLFWRYVAGMNARSELLSNVDTGWKGNIQRASSELYLPKTSVQRAVDNLEQTGMIYREPVQNSKVIGRGPRFVAPYQTHQENFIHWGNWIKAFLEIKSLIDKNIGDDLSGSLEERFTNSVGSTLKEQILRTAYTHRHGEKPTKNLISRLVDVDD